MSNATYLIAQDAVATGAGDMIDAEKLAPALKFITCGSVDDGKSTLIGRLLVDSKTVLQDQLAGVQRAGQTDLALLTDGLSAEREQGITIDVAYRYFATAQRKFIIGDTPGHEQYTRNMVTAASNADAAVVLVDATKLPWATRADAGLGAPPQGELLPQTRRHSLLLKLLQVPSVVFAVNKLDALHQQAGLAYDNIRAALNAFAAQAGIGVTAVVPISALRGWNVVDRSADHADETAPDWCGYQGPSLLQILERLPVQTAALELPFALPVQWVEKFSASTDTQQGRRIFWGRVATGSASVGQRVSVLPGGKSACIAQVLSHTRNAQAVGAGHGAGIVLDRELDVSRGDWLLAQVDPAAADAGGLRSQRELHATLAWLDDEPLVPGRTYLALHGQRWIKAKVKRIVHQLDIHTLALDAAHELGPNAIGEVELTLTEAVPVLPYARSRSLGALVLVDSASHRTAAAVLLH